MKNYEPEPEMSPIRIEDLKPFVIDIAESYSEPSSHEIVSAIGNYVAYYGLENESEAVIMEELRRSAAGVFRWARPIIRNAA